MTEAAVFLCDLTGKAAEPWAEAGFECWCVDIQHSIRSPRTVPHGRGNIHFVWGDARTWRPPEGLRIRFAAAFPPCTHVAGSGSRDFITKGGQMLRDALETFEACRTALAWSGAPYFVENPVGILSSIPHIGKPNHYFDPWEFTLYCKDDNYTKKTCLWTGNGFVMPAKAPHPEFVNVKPDDRIHKAPPSKDRANERSATPRGFSRAVFLANRPPIANVPPPPRMAA